MVRPHCSADVVRVGEIGELLAPKYQAYYELSEGQPCPEQGDSMRSFLSSVPPQHS